MVELPRYVHAKRRRGKLELSFQKYRDLTAWPRVKLPGASSCRLSAISLYPPSLMGGVQKSVTVRVDVRNFHLGASDIVTGISKVPFVVILIA